MASTPRKHRWTKVVIDDFRGPRGTMQQRHATVIVAAAMALLAEQVEEDAEGLEERFGTYFSDNMEYYLPGYRDYYIPPDDEDYDDDDDEDYDEDYD